jgi:thiamine-monophosphate kinase
VALSEFELIERYFGAIGAHRADVALGVGDDAAVVDVPAGMQLVAAIDTLVDGVHFPRGSPPASIGHRALAVNLSDLAAMGAEPAWALLALTLPEVREDWLAAFAAGFAALARAHGVALIGGDTTSGPLTISVQVLGLVPVGGALRRAGGRPGDLLYVSGSPGDAAEGLALEMDATPARPPAVPGVAAAGDEPRLAHERALRLRFLFPSPRIALGRELRGEASACIDVSDGLLADAGKLARASGCGVEIDAALLPLSAALLECAGRTRAIERALTGGDDYELCFAVPPERAAALEAQLEGAGHAVRRIGRLHAGAGAVAHDGGTVIDLSSRGFDHFLR